MTRDLRLVLAVVAGASFTLAGCAPDATPAERTIALLDAASADSALVRDALVGHQRRLLHALRERQHEIVLRHVAPEFAWRGLPGEPGTVPYLQLVAGSYPDVCLDDSISYGVRPASDNAYFVWAQSEDSTRRLVTLWRLKGDIWQAADMRGYLGCPP
jgi:hypothetical protein